MKNVIVFMADGFEECEGLIVVDLLRRAECNVTTVSITDRKSIVSSHGIQLHTDEIASEADYENADMIVLPGGMPGTINLGESEIVSAKCREFAQAIDENGKHTRKVAAICAAPSVLSGLGLLDGKNATCHPGFEQTIAQGGAIVTKAPVTVDGNIITGRGLGAAIDFGLELVKEMVDQETADRIAAAICHTH